MSEKNLKYKFKYKFNQCKKIALKYQLSINIIDNSLNKISEFKVTTPIIGGFSTGKTSMINVLLGEDILETDIIPETAIPTEISFGKNTVQFYKNENLIENINIIDLKQKGLDIKKIDLIKLKYDNIFLTKIKDVKIVDMPGFDSGIELHNKAIDKYLPNSLAYIITFSADEAVIKESIANFLSELKLHEVLVYVVLTKCDKATQSNINKTVAYMQKNIPKYLNLPNDIKIACVRSKKNKDVSELQKILIEIQSKYEDIFKKEFSIRLEESKIIIEKYIVSRLKNINLSDSELVYREEEIKEKAKSNLEKLEKEKVKFNSQVPNCIQNIKRKIEGDLRGNSFIFQSMILNNNDIQDKVNQLVRSAIITGIKSEFEPKLKKYLKNIADLISINFDVDTNLNLEGFKIATDEMVKNLVVKSIPVVLATIGGGLVGPIGAIIGEAIAIFVDNMFNTKHEKEKREMVRKKVESEIIPIIIEKSGCLMETEISSYIYEINENIENKIKEEREIIKKSFKDIKNKRKKEERDKQEQIKNLNKDLQEIRGIVNEN